MIRATMKTRDGRYVLMLGLSRENTKRLHAGMPILVDAHEVDDRMPELQIVILAGETEDDITAELRRSFDTRAEGTCEA